jgi:hypothetical protein
MNLYILLHDHKYGQSAYPFVSIKPLDQLPNAPDIADILGVDYEGRREGDESEAPEPLEELMIDGPYDISKLTDI